jgi:hypothetical protein
LLLRLVIALPITPFASLGRTCWHSVHTTAYISGRRLQQSNTRQIQEGYG